MNLVQKIFGTHSERELKRIEGTVQAIENLRPSMQALSDEELRGKTEQFKKRFAEGETLDDLLPEGEGNTLVSTLPAYLNALEGKGVHVVTVNDYLAKRDAEWMGEVHKFLGLSVGVVLNSMKSEERREAYNCDITYVTNNELGFDYLSAG